MNNGSANLVQLARGPLDRGVVVGGEVRDVPALARALDSFFEEHKLPRRGVRLGLATNRIGVRAFDVDGIADERQLANAIRFRAHEAVSIPIDEAVLDYHVVSETARRRGRRLAPDPPGGRLPRVDRPLHRGGQGREDRALRNRPRGVRPAARGRHGTGSRRRRSRRAPSSPSRSDTTARPSRSRTARSASSRACSNGAAASSRRRSPSTSASRPRRPSS